MPHDPDKAAAYLVNLFIRILFICIPEQGSTMEHASTVLNLVPDTTEKA